MASAPVSGSSSAAGDGPQPQVASPPDTAAAAPAAPAAARPPARPDALPPPRATGELNVLCYTLLSLFVVSFCVWAIFAWIDYGKRYAPLAEGWYAGGTRSVEITLVREDKQNLDCASDVVIEGLHCAFRADHQPFDSAGTDERVRLQPYNTVDQVAFLGAGLWSSPGLAGPLPGERFTVTCNYRMAGAIKSVATRWAPGGAFGAAKNALPAGALSDCVIPR